MEGCRATLKALVLSAIVSCALGISPANQLEPKNHADKCPDELVALCGACAASSPGMEVARCCGERDTQKLCEDLLLGDMDKRAKYFLGKRTRVNFLGKRLRNNFLGKRGGEEMEEEMEEEKRRSPFLGKRDEDEVAKRRSPFLGKRNDLEDEEDKRSRSPFLGKRDRSPFLGKRDRSPFLGKRENEADFEADLDEDKRRSPFLGKRSVDDALAALADDDFMAEEAEKRRSPFLGKRARSPFLGKRGRSPFLGKRQRSPFLGKRSEYDAEESYDGKRAKYFLGKRGASNDDELSREDMDMLVKRAKYFLGKRPKYFLG